MEVSGGCLCGTGLLHVLEARGPDIVVIKAGTLDDPSVVVPKAETEKHA